LCGKFLGWLE